ncbi:hypothetical protein PHLCEN_2v2131 [Hermanssonia centrifuga]|uniref:Uncharacterized protein n=1 Tax=Hermanssonia centrifuga TaxID=98765 RepID=A0A2R6RPX9_9APHY|nr:hypothetical protein PHLCEN_2v2131 [Hermanssonia centrifuga]
MQHFDCLHSLTPKRSPEGEEDLLEQDLIDGFRTNVVGVIHTTNAFLPLLSAASQKSTAKVITLSSGVGDIDLTASGDNYLFAPYCISKAAINMAVAKYAARFHDDNFVFLALSPGLVDTSTRPPTPKELELFMVMLKKFQQSYPDWDGKPITPETSVKMMLEVINRWEPKDSGAFVSHYGNKQWL